MAVSLANLRNLLLPGLRAMGCPGAMGTGTRTMGAQGAMATTNPGQYAQLLQAMVPQEPIPNRNYPGGYETEGGFKRKTQPVSFWNAGWQGQAQYGGPLAAQQQHFPPQQFPPNAYIGGPSLTGPLVAGTGAVITTTGGIGQVGLVSGSTTNTVSTQQQMMIQQAYASLLCPSPLSTTTSAVGTTSNGTTGTSGKTP